MDSNFRVSLINEQSLQIVSTDHNFRRERTAEEEWAEGYPMMHQRQIYPAVQSRASSLVLKFN